LSAKPTNPSERKRGQGVDKIAERLGQQAMKLLYQEFENLVGQEDEPPSEQEGLDPLFEKVLERKAEKLFEQEGEKLLGHEGEKLIQREAEKLLRLIYPTPYRAWWDLITGYEGAFRRVETLYQALLDPQAKLVFVEIDPAAGEILVRVEWAPSKKNGRPAYSGSKRAFFELDVNLIGKQIPAAATVCNLAEHKNGALGDELIDAWGRYLRGDRPFEELAKLWLG
jgi:hypothetical protein